MPTPNLLFNSLAPPQDDARRLSLLLPPALCTFLSPAHTASVCITTFLHARLSLLINFISVFFRLFALFIFLASISNAMCFSVSLHLSSHLSLLCPWWIWHFLLCASVLWTLSFSLINISASVYLPSFLPRDSKTASYESPFFPLIYSFCAENHCNISTQCE